MRRVRSIKRLLRFHCHEDMGREWLTTSTTWVRLEDTEDGCSCMFHNINVNSYLVVVGLGRNCRRCYYLPCAGAVVLGV